MPSSPSPKRLLVLGLALLALLLRSAEAMFYVVVEPVRT